MPGLIINGKDVEIDVLHIVNYHDPGHAVLKLRPGDDMRARETRWIRSIVLHNTKNIATVLKSGAGPFCDIGTKVAKFWTTSPAHAGAHLVVDWDGSITCHADLLLDAAYHASSMNEVSIGIEIYQDAHGVIYEAQIAAVGRLVLYLCQRFGIQKQCPVPDDAEEIPRIVNGGDDCVGVFGHCHQYHGKRFDPSHHVFEALVKLGFRTFSFRRQLQNSATGYHAFDDKAVWIDIQRKLRIGTDGVPGPKTRDALQARGFAYGLNDWVTPIVA